MKISIEKLRNFILRNGDKLKAGCLILVVTFFAFSGAALAAVQDGKTVSPVTNGGKAASSSTTSTGAGTGSKIITSTGGRNIFDVASNLLSDVQSKFIALSTAAAVIAVAIGAFMKKFSMGKQDKMELGGKIQRDAIIGWFVLNAMGFILSYLSGFLS